jgi:hypothetical protein
VVASHVEVANGLWRRFRGYLGRPEPGEGEGILLTPCSAVHTFGMAYALDILFLDARGRVLEVVGNLKPWRKTRRVRGARHVLEVRAGTIGATATEREDELAWMPPRTGAPYAGPTVGPNFEKHERAAVTP